MEKRWQYDKASGKRATSQCAHWWQRLLCQWIDFASRRCTKESQIRTSNFTRDRNSSIFGTTVSFVRIWSWNAWRGVVRKKSLRKLYVAPNSRTKTATSFPSIRCGLHIFHSWARVKASDRLFEHLIWSSFTVVCVHFRIDQLWRRILLRYVYANSGRTRRVFCLGYN